MKRTRDDAYASSQLKRPMGSLRGDSFGQSQIPGGGGGGGVEGAATSQKLTTNDALSYLKEVKDMFHDQREKYDMFLEVMKDFKAQRTDTAGVIARVKELFKGHNNLIFGFNTFLPKGYEITLDENEAPPKKTVEFEEAISFVNKIKKRFQNDEHVYKSFLDILNMYRKEHKDIGEVYSEVAALFEDHPDLLEEFTRFLPDTSAAPSTQHSPYGRNSFPRFSERGSTAPMMRPMQVDKHRYRRERLNSHDRDPSVDRPELDDDKALMKSHKDKEQRKRLDKEGRDRKIRDQDDREPDHDNNREKSRFSDKKISAKKAEGFGLAADFASYDDKDTLKSMYNQAFSFCEKVKEKLGSSDDYQAFLKCLHIFSNGIIKRNDLQNLVTDLLGKYPDLMDEFNEFLERCENIDGFLAGVISKIEEGDQIGPLSSLYESLGGDGQLSRTLKLEDKDKDKDHKREMNGAKDKERHREKYWGKSIQELDLSNCQLCTPSYRLLPEDYPIPVASQRSELGAQVLNDHWVSVTSGSEDYSFKHMRRNQYEESLFRCEDDRFELDMLLESVSSAAKCAEELYNSINENKINMEAPICIEDHFSALNLRCIERLYGDHGLDVLDILRKNPTHALPVILTRLKQKQDEWSRCRSDFNKVWAEIYAKNHYKSLDHRSFYFKQQDSKNLSTKSLVTEIKEKKAQQHKEYDILQAIAAGNKQPLIPHLEFEYSDVGIHEDLYKLIRYSCEEVFSSKDMSNKIMRLWTTFLELILGVPSRTHGTENVEDRKTGQRVAHFVASNAGGEGNSHEDSILMNSRLLKSDNEGDGRVNEVKNGQQTSLAASDKENGPLDCDRACRDDPLMDKGRNTTDCSEKISGFSKQIASDEQSTINNSSIAVRGETSMTKTSLEITSGCLLNPAQPTATMGVDDGVAISQGGSGPLMEGRDIAPPLPLANGILKESTKVKSHEEFAGPHKAEKEEGELSPNADSEEDNFVGYGDSSGQALSKSKHNIKRGNYKSRNGDEECGPEVGGDNGADADDEDSDNVSEAGEDASGSESAGDACSREEHEEDEDIECDDVEGKAESEGEAEGICDAQSAGGEGSSLPLSERFLLSVKPLTKHVSAVSLVEERNNSRVFYGNDDFFVLFRLHQILYERISLAKKYSMSAETKWKTTKEASSPDPYSGFMNSLYNLLDGSADNVKFEDECRAIIGNQSYILFTLDKLIYKLVRQLQTIVTDEIDNKLLQLYEYEKSRKPGKFIDSVYHANARVILHDENIYRFECSCTPSRVFVQLMDNMNEKPEVFAVSIDPNFSFYLYNDFLSVSPGKKEPHGIILQRNKRGYGDQDELTSICLAMEGAKVINGLECKIACVSSKISYVLDTEDFFFRPKKQRRTSSRSGTTSSRHHRARQERFLRFLSVS